MTGISFVFFWGGDRFVVVVVVVVSKNQSWYYFDSCFSCMSRILLLDTISLDMIFTIS